MTVPAGVTLHYDGNAYTEGMTVPKEAEKFLPPSAGQATAPKSTAPKPDGSGQ